MPLRRQHRGWVGVLTIKLFGVDGCVCVTGAIEIKAISVSNKVDVEAELGNNRRIIYSSTLSRGRGLSGYVSLFCICAGWEV